MMYRVLSYILENIGLHCYPEQPSSIPSLYKTIKEKGPQHVMSACALFDIVPSASVMTA